MASRGSRRHVETRTRVACRVTERDARTMYRKITCCEERDSFLPALLSLWTTSSVLRHEGKMLGLLAYSAPALLPGPYALVRGGMRAAPAMKVEAPPGSLLAQLADVTTLSIDTGDLDILESYAATGLITDATTNPLFVSQAGLSGDARYVAFVDKAIDYAKGALALSTLTYTPSRAAAGPEVRHARPMPAANADGKDGVLELAMDRLAVELGLEIVKLVPGYVSTEVDIRASFDTEESLRRARRIIAMYEAAGVPRSRVLVKLAGTWEGIAAARILEKEGITCNITLIFGFIQALAAAQAGARLISPFPGRIKDWAAANGGSATYEPKDDPGVVCVSRMYRYYKKHGHEGTICALPRLDSRAECCMRGSTGGPAACVGDDGPPRMRRLTCNDSRAAAQACPLRGGPRAARRTPRTPSTRLSRSRALTGATLHACFSPLAPTRRSPLAERRALLVGLRSRRCRMTIPPL